MIENKNIKEMNIYWANICILNRMESEKMAAAAGKWQSEKNIIPRMIYLGDTEEVQMYEQMDSDMAEEKINFDLLVSSRFDLFCSKKYLQSHKEKLYPIGHIASVRDEIKRTGVEDPDGLFYPLAVLPHFIICNSKLIDKKEFPQSLEDLLDPKWAGKIFIGATALPSAKSFLFAMWYKFGNKGLETCIANWRQKSAPSAARHGLVKDEFPIALLPGIFAGSGPEDKLISICPKEGAPILPSYAAVKKTEYSEDVVDFIKKSAADPSFLSFYKNQALAYPSDPTIELPDTLAEGDKMFFPDWEWIEKQDMDYFEKACSRMPLG